VGREIGKSWRIGRRRTNLDKSRENITRIRRRVKERKKIPRLGGPHIRLAAKQAYGGQEPGLGKATIFLVGNERSNTIWSRGETKSPYAKGQKNDEKGGDNSGSQEAETTEERI